MGKAIILILAVFILTMWPWQRGSLFVLHKGYNPEHGYIVAGYPQKDAKYTVLKVDFRSFCNTKLRCKCTYHRSPIGKWSLTSCNCDVPL